MLNTSYGVVMRRVNRIFWNTAFIWVVLRNMVIAFYWLFEKKHLVKSVRPMVKRIVGYTTPSFELLFDTFYYFYFEINKRFWIFFWYSHYQMNFLKKHKFFMYLWFSINSTVKPATSWVLQYLRRDNYNLAWFLPLSF